MKLYIWFFSENSDIGYVVGEDFRKVYYFWKPGSLAYKEEGLCLESKYKKEKSSVFFCNQYNEAEVKFKVDGWDGFWKWLFKKYAVDLL